MLILRRLLMACLVHPATAAALHAGDALDGVLHPTLSFMVKPRRKTPTNAGRLALLALVLVARTMTAVAEPPVTPAGVAPVLAPVVRWNQKLPAVNDHETLPVAAGPGGTRLYAVSGGQVLTLETESGKILNATPGDFRGGPVLHGTTLLVTGDDWLKALDIALDAPAVQWTAKSVGPLQSESKYTEVMGRPRAVVVGERAIFGGPGKCNLPADGSFTDTRLYAIDLKTGTPAWVLDTKRMVGGRMLAADAGLGLCFCALTGERVERTVTVQKGPDKGKPRLLAEGDKNGALIAVDVRTGQEKWRTEIGTHMTASGPVVSDGVLYCAGNTEALALQAADGKVLWRTPRSNHAYPLKVINPNPPAVVTRTLFVVTMDKTTDAFDRKDGALRWSVKREGDVGAMTLAAARQVVYTAASHSGNVQAIDASNGTLLWEHSLSGNEATACVSLLPLEGRLVIASRSPSPRIYCLETAK